MEFKADVEMHMNEMMTRMKLSDGQRSIKTNNKFFPLRVEAHQHGRQMDSSRDASLVSVPIHLKNTPL